MIKIENIGKRYTLVHDDRESDSLRETIALFLKDPFAKHVSKESFWALRNISLEIKKGEMIGVIGKNGSGKSTLLKLIAGITKPTEGKIYLYGRVSSLLEIGTGFHPDLTGKENIFLNGVIMGMSRKEVKDKFDRIVDFAGVGKFLDVPVKRYSSGMYIRLAFAVAAHIEPDILIVDEVLSVGDAEFQEKCMKRMEEISKIEGRTVLFASHNLEAIQRLCNRTVLLEQGRIIRSGKTREVIRSY